MRTKWGSYKSKLKHINQMYVFYNKMILNLSTIDCLASSNNSENEKFHSWLKGQVTDIWMPRQATSSSLTPHVVLLRLSPKGRWPSQVDKGHSLAEVHLHLCFPAGPKLVLKCITSRFCVVLFYLLTHLFIQSRLCARHWKQQQWTKSRQSHWSSHQEGNTNINHRII